MAMDQSENVNARQSRQLIERLLRRIHAAAYAAVRHQAERERVDRQRRDLEAQNPDLAATNLYRRSMYVFVLPLIIAVYAIDYMLFTPSTEYYAEMLFPNNPRIILITCALMPIAIILVEIYIAIQITAARQDANEYGASSIGYWAWLGLGLAFASFMPASVIATHLAANADAGESNIATAFGWQAAALAVLALAAHASILFGGSLAQQAKAFVTYRLSQNSLNRKHRSEDREFERDREGACTAFSAYMRDLANHNQAYANNRIEPGPFSALVRDFINEQFGYEIIQAPNKAGNGSNGSERPASPAAAADEPPRQGSAEPDNGSDGEAEYLRTILKRKLRDEDSEVKP